MTTLYYPADAAALAALRATGRGFAATIGFFDGVHHGHRSLIGQLKEAAAQRGLLSMVVTFDQHPRQVVQPQWQPQLLTTLAEKARYIGETGIDVLVVLRFDRQMAALSAHNFMQQVLHSELGVQLLLTGYDNRFGHNREEGFADYRRYGREMGIEVCCAQPCSEGGVRFSSSLVRQLIGEGRVVEAARCLGRAYTVSGRVVHGEQIGRTLGFPTANVSVEQTGRLLPPNGVYAVRVQVEGERLAGETQAEADQQAYVGMMNIGFRPTFNGSDRRLEVFIFDFKGNLYDRRLTVSFIERLREERSFASPEALVAQIRKDAAEVERLFSL